jgi:hypothetical protein
VAGGGRSPRERVHASRHRHDLPRRRTRRSGRVVRDVHGPHRQPVRRGRFPHAGAAAGRRCFGAPRPAARRGRLAALRRRQPASRRERACVSLCRRATDRNRSADPRPAIHGRVHLPDRMGQPDHQCFDRRARIRGCTGHGDRAAGSRTAAAEVVRAMGEAREDHCTRGLPRRRGGVAVAKRCRMDGAGEHPARCTSARGSRCSTR